MTHPHPPHPPMAYPLPRPTWRSLALAALAALGLAAGTARAAPLDDIRRQVEGNQFEQAWQTAQAHPQLLGDVHFDFLYGLAAINVGRVVEGVLALERHLSAVPANDRARLELARGYFLLGEYPRARSEFEFLLRYNPPAGVRNSIATFLQAMQVRESGQNRANARLYVEVGGGHDNNVNLGTFRDEVPLSTGTFSLAGTPSQQVADSFGQVAVGGQQVYRVSNRLSVFAGADLDHRGNLQQKDYDISNASVQIGFTQLSGATLWRATVGTSQLVVGGNRYRKVLQTSAEANTTLGPELTVMAFAQYADMRHSTAEQVRDARATTVGAMLTRSFADTRFDPQLGVRLSYTQEDNQRQRSDFSKQLPVLRLFASATPLDRTRLSLGLSFYEESYRAADFVFQTERKDTGVAADVVLNHALDTHWSLRADAVWATTRSNQDLYDKSRKAASLKLRYQY